MSALPQAAIAGEVAGGSSLTLTPEHLAQRAAAKQRRRKIDRATAVATASAWSLAVMATLALPFALFSAKGAFVALGLGVCACFEFRGRRGLRQLDIEAPARLAWNQLLLAGVIAVYCVWSAYAAWFGPDTYAQAVATTPELGPVLEPFTGLIRQVTVAVYAVVLVISLGVQAAAIMYYRSRRKFIQAYLDKTPEWVRQLD